MTKTEIEQLAEQVANQYNPEGLSPFPFDNITSALNDLEIVIVDIAETVSGAIAFSNTKNKFVIVINKNKPKTRQQFTIAHEIGHYYLHKSLISNDLLVDGESTLDSGNILYRADGQEKIDMTSVETEANNFAATLIMPKALVTKAWNTLKSVEECAHIFGVSVSAMSIRLERLHLLNS